MKVVRLWMLGVVFLSALLLEITANETEEQVDENGTVDGSDDQEDNIEEDEEDYSESDFLHEYEPTNEPPEFACRRDPSWRTVNYEECQELMGWHTSVKHDTLSNLHWLGDKQEHLMTCITNAFEEAKSKHAWAT
jgi:hypothetical protein